MAKLLLPFLLLLLPNSPGSQPTKLQPVRILMLRGYGDGVISTGGPLRFDEQGIQFVGKPEYSGKDTIINGVHFTPGPEFWAMIEQNLKEADAEQSITVTKGKIFYRGRLVNLGSSQVNGFWDCIFWQDWVLGIGSTTKFPPPPAFSESMRELIYFNTKSLQGNSMKLCSKCQPSFWILSK